MENCLSNLKLSPFGFLPEFQRFGRLPLFYIPLHYSMAVNVAKLGCHHLKYFKNDKIYVMVSFLSAVRGHPFKVSANFHDFLPLPLKNAKVLNGWSLRKLNGFNFIQPTRKVNISYNPYW